MNYVENKDFKDMSENIERLINVLNHRVTKLEVNVNWLKRFAATQTGLLIAIFLAILGLAFKSL